jgi:HPt (histidine-containing phosphotransfer) domain-containing protein
MAVNDIDTALALASFDRDELLKAIDGDMELFNEIIGVFREEAAGLVSAMGAAIANGDAEGVETTAHALKGSSLTISALKIARLAHILESMGRDRDLDAAEKVFACVKAGLTELEKIFGAES